jgi:hypothetical protein
MDDQQPTFKVIDRRPFNPDGTPREVPPEERPAKDIASSFSARDLSTPGTAGRASSFCSAKGT